MAAVTVSTIAIGAAIGAGVGAVATYAAGGRGDALWKGALTGAVGGAITGGVGSWATGAFGGTVGGAIAGASGGVAAGALGTALSGGTGQDYLKNILTGGVAGGALGAAGGYLSGGESATAGATPSGLESATGEVGSGLTSGTAGLDTGGAMGLTTGGEGAAALNTSVTGASAATPAMTSTPLADTVSSLDTGGMMAGGGSTVAPALESTTPSLASLGSQGQSQANLSMQNLGLSPAGEGTTMPAMANTSMAPATQAGNQTPTGFWDNFFGGAKTTSKGTGMGLEDYLKMQGKAQLLGGGIKALGAMATAPETAQNRQALMDLYNEQNEQNQYYQNLMRGTYENPQGYLGSPEAAATRSAALQKILAQNAAAGRRTAGSAAYNQLMMNQLQNLGAYRQGMPRPSYGTALQTLQGAQQYSPTADIFGGLASMATPLSLYSLFG